MNAAAEAEPANQQNSVALRERRAAVGMETTGAGAKLAVQNLADMVTFADVMSRAGIALPRHLRGQPAVCLAVTMQALRWEMDPFAVGNKTYSVNDRLAYEAQLVAAVVNTRAPIAKAPDYSFSGEGPTRRCKVVVRMLDGSELPYETPEFQNITTKNSPLWKADPDQQLGYFAIRSWARRHTPEVILGVYTPDEVRTFRGGLAGGAAPPALDSGFTQLSPQASSVARDEAIDADFTDDTFDAEEQAVAEVANDNQANDNVDPPSPEPASQAAPFDPIEWAGSLQLALSSFTNVDDLRLAWEAHKAELKAAAPAAFHQLNQNIADHAKALALKAAG
jgi:hypothetical protein